jgi:hypothetical protein
MKTIEQVVARSYDARRNRRGDMSEMPLAEDFRFLGPVASFETAAGCREIDRALPLDRARGRPARALPAHPHPRQRPARVRHAARDRVAGLAPAPRCSAFRGH